MQHGEREAVFVPREDPVTMDDTRSRGVYSSMVLNCIVKKFYHFTEFAQVSIPSTFVHDRAKDGTQT